MLSWRPAVSRIGYMQQRLGFNMHWEIDRTFSRNTVYIQKGCQTVLLNQLHWVHLRLTDFSNCGLNPPHFQQKADHHFGSGAKDTKDVNRENLWRLRVMCIPSAIMFFGPFLLRFRSYIQRMLHEEARQRLEATVVYHDHMLHVAAAAETWADCVVEILSKFFRETGNFDVWKSFLCSMVVQLMHA